MPKYYSVGNPVNRIDAVDKVTGKLKYPSDMILPNAVYAVPVLSSEAHALVESIDISYALQVPGCLAVYTGKDVAGLNKYGVHLDRPVLSSNKVCFVGDIVAVAVGETRASAEEAARKVMIEYTRLPMINSIEKALEKDAPLIHEHLENNICHQVHYCQGDMEHGFKNASLIVENTYRVQEMDHAFLETEAGISYLDDDVLVICAGTQNIFYDQQQVASALDIPIEQVKIVSPHCGGAFGGKGDITVQILIGLVTLKTGRPCKMTFSREARFITGVKRHPAVISMKTGVAADGTILAHQVKVFSDTGAYTVYGDVILEIMVENCTSFYRIPNCKIDAYAVYTNNGVGGAFRGFGAAQACFALECQMSNIAKKLKIDELDFRIKNCLKVGETGGLGQKIVLDLGIRNVLEKAKHHPVWLDKKQLAEDGGASNSLARGFGVACGMKGFGIGTNHAPDYGYAKIELLQSGKFKLYVGVNELGQGSYTALAQIAAEVLGCQVDNIEIEGADSFLSKETGATASSRVTYAVGRAVYTAAKEMLDGIQERASILVGRKISCLMDDEEVPVGKTSIKKINLYKKVANAMEFPLTVESRERCAYSDWELGGGLPHPHALFSSNTQIVQVLVNKLTGEVTVERVVAFPDVGFCINPQGVEGQSDGGIVMGAAYALLEKVERSECQPLTKDFASYPIPTSKDIPLQITNCIVQLPEKTGPFGAKGMGENATLPTAPAIVNALNNALNTNFVELPVTPEVIMAELNVT